MMLYFRSLKTVKHDIIVMFTFYMVFLVSSMVSVDVLSVICRPHNLRSPFQTPIHLVAPIIFSFRAHVFFYLWTIRRFSWIETTVSHWRFNYNCSMNSSADVFKCGNLLKPVLGGVDGQLHFPVPSMNRLNQPELEHFTILPCWAFFRDSVFLYCVTRCDLC
jgi:hypothetical protein